MWAFWSIKVKHYSFLLVAFSLDENRIRLLVLCIINAILGFCINLLFFYRLVFPFSVSIKIRSWSCLYYVCKVRRTVTYSSGENSLRLNTGFVQGGYIFIFYRFTLILQSTRRVFLRVHAIIITFLHIYFVLSIRLY